MLTPEPVNSIRKEIELKNAELWPLFKVPNFTFLYVIIFVPYLRRGKGKALQSLSNQPCCQVFETISSVAHDLAERRWWRHTVCLFYKSARFVHRDKGYQYYPKVIVVYVLRNMPFFTRIFNSKLISLISDLIVSHAGVVGNRISSLPVYPASYLNVTSSPALFPQKMGPTHFLREKPWGRGWSKCINF